MPKQHGSADSEIKPTERRSEEEEYNPVSTTNSITKVQKEEYLIKNACYPVTKYYLCKQNNKRSFFSRKQRHKAFRSFPNRYLFSYINMVTSLFSDRYIFIIILRCNNQQTKRAFLQYEETPSSHQGNAPVDDRRALL